MKGYIYTLYAKADPSLGWRMTDPIFGRTPTLGACVPNIRRVVERGDHIFVVSGRVEGVRQYVVGGFEVAEKIDALAAYHRFPDRRLKQESDGALSGNIIVRHDGGQHPLDYHKNFERRVDNYLVGTKQLLVRPPSVERARFETLPFLNELFGRNGDKVFDVIGRWRRLDASQIEELRNWLLHLNSRG